MTTTMLRHPDVQTVLSRLFAAAAGDDDREPDVDPATLSGCSAQERADTLAELYMPISEAGGRLLYCLARAVRPETVLEFGTSFGISTLYLAAAVADNRVGHVYTSEMSARKIEAATANLAEAGLSETVTILPGDALRTLPAVEGPVQLALLDGWKDLCVPLLQAIEPHLAPGALVVADDVISHPSMAPYLDYVRDPDHGYETLTFPVEDGMEVSCWTGADAC